jgi:RNA polymerase sigma factor (sigma-70 family)
VEFAPQPEADVTIPSLDRLVKRLHRTVEAGRASAGEDAELIQRFCAAGDHAAFEALVRRHGGLVLAACRAVLADEADVEDAFQATFLVLLQSARSIRRRQSVGSFLYGVARRVALRAKAAAAARQRREQRAAAAEVPAPEPSWRDACDALHRELERLPAKYRRPIWLCYFEGRTRDEAAAALGRSPGAVKGDLQRGRELLRARLEKRGIALPASLLLTGLAASAAGAAPPRLVEAVLATASGPAPAAVAALAKGVAMRPVLNKLLLALCAAAGAALLGLGVMGFAAGTRARDDPPARAANAGGKPAAGAEMRSTLSGRVLGPDGKPVAGARLHVPRLKGDRADPDAVVEAVVNEHVGNAGPDGRFTVRLPPARYAPRPYVIATAPGLGVDWAELAPGGPGPGGLTLKLPADVPITGRVVSTEGKPLRGVRVRVLGVYTPPEGRLETFFTIWRSKSADHALGVSTKRLYGSVPGLDPPVRTDAAGRFSLRGLGAERIVAVGLDGAGIARAEPFVVTRRGFDPTPYNDALKRRENEVLRVLNRFAGLFPPDLKFVAAAGKTVEGVVTDADTGNPLAGCIVSARGGYLSAARALTKADGRYRLTGLPQDTKGYHVNVGNWAGVYLSQVAVAPDTPGTAPVRMDVKLAPGSVVAGRVIDPLTGKGVEAAVRLAPARNNPNVGGKPGSDFYHYNRGIQETGADGRFRIVTVPGRSVLLVQAPMPSGGAFPPCPYRMAGPDKDHKDLFVFYKHANGWYALTAGDSTEYLGMNHAAKVVEVPKSGTVTVEVRLERGRTRELRVLDPAGNPLSGAWVSGLSDGWPMALRLTGAAGTVCALGGEPRPLALLHHEKGLGAAVTLKAEEAGPVVVKLAPLGLITGKLRDGDGAPLAGAEVWVSPSAQVGRSLYQEGPAATKPARTAADGTFTLAGVVPGMPFRLSVKKGGEAYGGKVGQRVVKAGETLDLGEQKMEALK